MILQPVAGALHYWPGNGNKHFLLIFSFFGAYLQGYCGETDGGFDKGEILVVFKLGYLQKKSPK